MVVPLHHLFGIAAVVALAGAQVPHGGSPRSFGEASVSDKTAVIAANVGPCSHAHLLLQ